MNNKNTNMNLLIIKIKNKNKNFYNFTSLSSIIKILSLIISSKVGTNFSYWLEIKAFKTNILALSTLFKMSLNKIEIV